MPLVSKSFENMRASTVEVRDRYDVILYPLVRERELALLSVYGVTLSTLGEVFRALTKNQQQ